MCRILPVIIPPAGTGMLAPPRPAIASLPICATALPFAAPAIMLCVPFTALPASVIALPGSTFSGPIFLPLPIPSLGFIPMALVCCYVICRLLVPPALPPLIGGRSTIFGWPVSVPTAIALLPPTSAMLLVITLSAPLRILALSVAASVVNMLAVRPVLVHLARAISRRLRGRWRRRRATCRSRW